jgi:hypothetical protein
MRLMPIGFEGSKSLYLKPDEYKYSLSSKLLHHNLQNKEYIMGTLLAYYQ